MKFFVVDENAPAVIERISKNLSFYTKERKMSYGERICAE